jgi:DNA-binding CsgD family transcriptional regulator
MGTLATDRAADGRGEVVYEGVNRLGRDEVTLRLRRGGGDLFTLERQLIRAGGVTLTQVFPVGADAELHDFASADPYGDSLQSSYLALKQRYLSEARGRTVVQRPGIPGDFLDQIGEIEHCRHEAELLQIAQTVTRALGAEQYIFSWLVLDAKSSDVIEHRYLAGCDPAWLNKYIDHVWYMNDPSLEYAKRNATPVLLSRLDLYNDVHWLTEAAAHGFRNNLVCPVHAGTNSVLVMLQASNAEPTEAGEGILWRNRRELRALACELLDWCLAGLQQQATSQFGLSEEELKVLRLVHGGGTASNVSDALQVSAKTVYSVVYPRINNKMGTPNINKAAAMAVSCGLIK